MDLQTVGYSHKFEVDFSDFHSDKQQIHIGFKHKKLFGIAHGFGPGPKTLKTLEITREGFAKRWRICLLATSLPETDHFRPLIAASEIIRPTPIGIMVLVYFNEILNRHDFKNLIKILKFQS